MILATDHPLGTTGDNSTRADYVVNVCYGTSVTGPTSSTTTEGALYLTYTA